MSDQRPPRRAPERYERFIPIALVVLAGFLVIVVVVAVAVLFSALS